MQTARRGGDEAALRTAIHPSGQGLANFAAHRRCWLVPAGLTSTARRPAYDASTVGVTKCMTNARARQATRRRRTAHRLAAAHYKAACLQLREAQSEARRARPTITAQWGREGPLTVCIAGMRWRVPASCLRKARYRYRFQIIGNRARDHAAVGDTKAALTVHPVTPAKRNRTGPSFSVPGHRAGAPGEAGRR